MADTNFVDSVTKVPAAWLNDVNKLRYGTGDGLRGAALLEFLQAGTGAVAEALQEALRRAQVQPQHYMTVAQKADVAARTLLVDVKDAVMAAHDALPSTGGTITLPHGSYAIATEPSFTKAVILQGAGRGATELVVTSNAAS